MTLHYQQQGQGLPIVFLHGWGFWGDIFAPVTAELNDYQTFTVDLAGYGQSPTLSDYSLKNLADSIVTSLPLNQAAVFVGWSFGGLVALAISRYYPEKLRGLVLLASTPCFTQRPDWPYAVSLENLDKFGQQVAKNHGQALKNFISLHVRDKQQRQAVLQQLQQQPTPSLHTLNAGLHLLKTVDSRKQLFGLKMPVLWLFGQRDTLIPQQLSQLQNQQTQTHCVQGAGHLPFLSHKNEVTQQLRTFLSQF